MKVYLIKYAILPEDGLPKSETDIFKSEKENLEDVKADFAEYFHQTNKRNFPVKLDNIQIFPQK